jgi:diguanylate cyclase (GGDEF)-like protein
MDTDLDMFIKQSNSKDLTAVFVDADRFKGINDNFGHDTGDRALQYLAKKLQKHAPLLEGEIYRYGGEEFVILCFCPRELLLNKLEDLRVDI